MINVQQGKRQIYKQIANHLANVEKSNYGLAL